MSKADQYFHESWLGMVQPDGLVVSLPVLTDADIVNRARGKELHPHFIELCCPEGNLSKVAISDRKTLFNDILGYQTQDFDHADRLPAELELYVPEGRQTLTPTKALRRKTNEELRKRDKRAGDDSTPASRAGRAYQMLVWELPDALDFDRPETRTGPWAYPAAAKFDRLLRHCRVPIGLLVNDQSIRLIYAPHGQSSGSLTFNVDHMVTTAGRDIFDAFVMLLSADRFFAYEPDRCLPGLLEGSRERQADVTEELAKQVFDALQILLSGFEAAAERDGWDLLNDALHRDDGHLYAGLLTVLLRTVFVLYAEDRGLLPVEHDFYASHVSLLGLFEDLQQDAAAYPDSMNHRFGAWGRMISLFRAIFEGVEHGGLVMPARRGELFNPHTFAFLEGWGPAGSAPIKPVELRAEVMLPRVDDGTVHRVLEKLLILEGQRLSYRALDVEQIGSVYEALMGYHVIRALEPMVCLRGDKRQRVWLGAEELLAIPKSQRPKWLQQTLGLSKAQATKISKAVAQRNDVTGALSAIEEFRIKGTDTASLGRLVLQPGEERRRTSSHYTPRSLSAPIVQRTLEPLIGAMGSEPSSEALLDLKVCDPAMGSGAFLVEACRFLADQVIAAWTREEKTELVASAHEDVTTHARRLVAQRCLYGVDKNPFAVSLAKLSLWLVTLAKEEPFTFVDHCLKCGDSLVGLDFEQIKSFHWKAGRKNEGSKQLELWRRELDTALQQSIQHRQAILDLAGDGSVVAQREKEMLLLNAEYALHRVRLIGDVIVGAYFSETKDKARELERVRRLDQVLAWLEQDDDYPPAELLAFQEEIRGQLRPFHWMVEFPEIFSEARLDPLSSSVSPDSGPAYLDAFVGNPPFAGKNGIAAMGGSTLVDWLKQIHPGAHGNADYSAHFFRRADTLLGPHGTIGLIATNTIAQGDTRATALQYLANNGHVIFDATQHLPWPGDAAVTVSVVHTAKGSPKGVEGLDFRLGNLSVAAINSRLRPKLERPDPMVLGANSGVSFIGSYVLGMGFTLTPEERTRLVSESPVNAARIFPYLGGSEVNSSPTHDFDRYVINFGQMSLDEAEQWPDLLDIVRSKVKPERDRNNREVRRKYWWRFGEVAPALYQAIRDLPRCLVTARVSKHCMFHFQPSGRVLSEQLVVFALDRHAEFGVLQSRIHEAWARLLSSSMKTDLRYAPSDCFETFPFPIAAASDEAPDLDAAGRSLYEARAAYMVETNQGLTTTYNLLKEPECVDPAIEQLRDLHIAMEGVVLKAYGWDDIQVPPYTTPATAKEAKVRRDFEDEVIDRLFVLNAERAEEERALGMTKKTKSRDRTGGSSAKKKTTKDDQLKLI